MDNDSLVTLIGAAVAAGLGIATLTRRIRPPLPHEADSLRRLESHAGERRHR